jgi:hypothetical protein
MVCGEIAITGDAGNRAGLHRVVTDESGVEIGGSVESAITANEKMQLFGRTSPPAPLIIRGTACIAMMEWAARDNRVRAASGTVDRSFRARLVGQEMSRPSRQME